MQDDSTDNFEPDHVFYTFRREGTAHASAVYLFAWVDHHLDENQKTVSEKGI